MHHLQITACVGRYGAGHMPIGESVENIAASGEPTSPNSEEVPIYAFRLREIAQNAFLKLPISVSRLSACFRPACIYIFIFVLPDAYFPSWLQDTRIGGNPPSNFVLIT